MSERLPRPGIAFLLSQLGGQSSRLWSARLDRLGMDPREVMLFRFVARSEGRSQREVAAAIGLPDSRIVGLVDRLEARGWVERHTSAADRRTRTLHLTDEGRAILDRIARVSAEHEADLTRGLDAEGRSTLRELLARMATVQGLPRGVHPSFLDPAAEPEGEAAAHAAHDRESDGAG